MAKSLVIKARIEQSLERKIAELSHQTGLNTSELLRQLIANAKLEPRPMPVATLPVNRESAVVVEGRGAF